LEKQCAGSVRELELARSKYQRQQGLYEQKMVSLQVVNDEEFAFIQTTKAQSLAERNLAEARIEAAKMEKQLRDLDHERAETLRKAREQVRSTLLKLRGEIDVWEADYVLRAPADGTLAFYDFWTDQQYVTAGRQVFLVLPETSKLVGRTTVTPGGAGKIKPGQRVLIRLDDYPYREFGLVQGSVQSISQVARDGANLVLVDLPYPLATSFGRPLQFKQEMTGEAQIVTEDIRLLGRVLYEVRRAFVNHAK
jgi:HlyD family secretion protein